MCQTASSILKLGQKPAYLGYIRISFKIKSSVGVMGIVYRGEV